MHARRFGCLPLLAALSFSTAIAANGCKLLITPPVAVTIRDLRPTILAKINGVSARFIIDSGAFNSLLSPAAAAQYKLALHVALPPQSLWGMATSMQNGLSSQLSIQGFGGGEAHVKIATVNAFTYLGVTLPNVPFMVGGNDIGNGAVGVLGENMLRIADTEYDFGDGLMRLVKPVHCGGQPLAFWAKKGQPVAVVGLRAFTAHDPQIIGHGFVNGHPISIMFDTGAPRSFLSLAAAERAGITPESPGVTPAGRTTGVAGDNTVRVWSAPIDDVEIGTEKIEHTHLFIAKFGNSDLDARDGRADMVVGEDFFLSHHILVAYNQRKLYFTYTGGPVFDLGLPQSDWRHASGAANTTRRPTSGSPASASELMRRGLAYAAQREFRHALADLGRACRLAPKDAKCLFSQGTVYEEDKRPAKALEEFDAAIQLRPNDLEAHLARAELQLARKGWPNPAAKAAAVTEATADLDTVARLSAPEADVRLLLGSLYGDVGRYVSAIHQVELWSHYHERDIGMAEARMELADAWNNLCYRRARRDQDLKRAMRECDRALRYGPKVAAFLDSGGLVNLRLGKLDAAVDDYDAALRRNARLPTSLYGRGLAELRLGESAKGRADLTAAERLDPSIAGRFARWGLSP